MKSRLTHKFSQQTLFNGLCLLFVAGLAAWLMINSPAMIGGLFFVMILMSGFLLAFFDLSPAFRILVLFLPLSVRLGDEGSGITILTPSEPLIGILAVAFCCSFFTSKKKTDVRFLRHPVSVFVIAYLVCLLISAAFSSLPTVSLKAVTVQCAYILVFYFLSHELLKARTISAPDIFVFYALALVPVIINTFMNHAVFGFSKDTSNTAPLPFFADHTIYSACIAFLIPVLAFRIFFARRLEQGYIKTFFCALLLALFCVAVFLSYCRAAWLSLALTAVFSFVLLLRIRLKWIFLSLFVLAGILFLNHSELMLALKENRNDSNSKYAGLLEQTKSITNITNDQSNAERLNRWSCALRMFRDRPLTGFGPGTFQFEYLAYQQPKDMTPISVTSPYNNKPGRGGSAHSEYFLALSESGAPAFICFSGLIIFAIGRGYLVFHRLHLSKESIAMAIALTGLISYGVHALFNNFLDTDKAAFLFWTSLSILATIDLKLQAHHDAGTT